MRNLGLALVLIGSLLAPHAALAKKHASSKKGRSAKSQRHLKRAHQTRDAVAPNSRDELASAVAAHKRDDKPVLTAAEPMPPAAAPAAPAAQRAAEPVAPNAPMRMDNQSSDDEVPGAHKKR